MSDIITTDQRDRSVVTSQPGSMLSVIVEAATNPAVDVAKLKELMAMQERLEERQAVRAFNAAVVAVSSDMPRVKKNGTIDLGVGKDGKARAIPFARWEDVDAILRPLMSRNGLTLSFDSTPRPGEGGGAVISGTLLHVDGHSRTVSIPLPLDSGPGRNNLQAMGSTLSYGKRYCAEMLFNIVREGVDDDGQAGGTRYISQEMKAEIIDLIEATKTDTVSFLRTFEARSVDEIEAGAFTAAKNMLMTKRAKMVKPGEAPA